MKREKRVIRMGMAAIERRPHGVEQLDAHLIFTVMAIHDMMVPTRVETTIFSVDIGFHQKYNNQPADVTLDVTVVAGEGFPSSFNRKSTVSPVASRVGSRGEGWF